jgi:heterodisulfide reductase subunit C
VIQRSAVPTVGRANGRPRNPRVTRGRTNGLMGALDCSVCTGQCPVRQRLQIINGRLCHNRKEICTGQCPVVHRTVRCTSRKKARFAFLDCSQWLLAALGL